MKLLTSLCLAQCRVEARPSHARANRPNACSPSKWVRGLALLDNWLTAGPSVGEDARGNTAGALAGQGQPRRLQEGVLGSPPLRCLAGAGLLCPLAVCYDADQMTSREPLPRGSAEHTRRGLPMKKSEAAARARSCYRCGKGESAEQALLLLPGSTHITLCQMCFDVVWGWHRQPSSAPPAAAPKRPDGKPSA